MTDPNTGKEFEQSHHADDDKDGAALGTGKQFAPGVHDPQDDEHTAVTKAAGKGFASTEHPDAEQPDPDATEDDSTGSGKQFRPERDNL
jgi:hypothetical protein